ncbi:hemolysin-type calcium-binding repeat family protein [Synechococcus sp. BIOS-E4-1]|uniref:calcium-binding protein n=1 Tax=Synechococcus sp. BIOS-E4-1 TaxID=1400864 RepID=UPI0016446179|nr:calcium-binding protein [Synechococcus sp. BIOS-E4-1]QNI52692.1 hemolysin-type calcium-binding repeat family protein [Synechococcus sp. BIOS-E4-1]
MASFTTLPGPGGSDSVGATYVGSDAIDNIVFEGNASDFFLGAEKANDFIAFNNVNALTTGTFSNGSMRGGDGNDTFAILNNQVNHVGVYYSGNKGDDIFASQAAGIAAANSTVHGGQGDDTLNIGNSTGTLFNGNKGDDNIDVIGAAAGGTIGGGQGDDTLRFVGGTSASNSWLLGTGDDSLVEGAANRFLGGNTIEGGDGNDTITMNVGTTSSATINGGDGVDALTGAAAADNINGGEGSDVITGRANADVLTGGGGVDTFNYATVGQSINGASANTNSSVDVLADFFSATDRIATSAAGLTMARAINNTANATDLAGFANFAAAYDRAANLNNVNDSASLLAVGSGTSWTGYLFGSRAAGAADFIVQIGTTGSFATAQAAATSVTAADFV